MEQQNGLICHHYNKSRKHMNCSYNCKQFSWWMRCVSMTDLSTKKFSTIFQWLNKFCQWNLKPFHFEKMRSMKCQWCLNIGQHSICICKLMYHLFWHSENRHKKLQCLVDYKHRHTWFSRSMIMKILKFCELLFTKYWAK